MSKRPSALDIRAISLDLDDTLWPIAPVMRRIDEQVQAWLQRHCPQVAEAFPSSAMRALRQQVELESPQLLHDLSALRRLTLERVFQPFGMGREWVEALFAIYETQRNRVDCYEDAEPALHALAARLPLISISNGTADLRRIGLQQHFQFSISAREFGAAKPDPRIFLHACSELGLAPEQILHVGDDAHLDVLAAHAVGMRTAWINRSGHAWAESIAPDMDLCDLGQLAAWLTDQPMH